MIDVGRDAEGVRLALEELFEEDFQRRRLRRSVEGASPETLARLEKTLPARALSPGYYRWAWHLLSLESEREAGIALDPARLLGAEVTGLVALGDARRSFRAKHPECTACGAQQDSKFAPQCINCGAKFRRGKGD